MNLQQLKILVLLADRRKLTDVAQMMGLKHSTVSFHMKKCEEYFGAPLFERHAQRVFLNETAKRLLPYARQIVAASEEAEAVVRKTLLHSKGKVVLGCSANIGSAVLPRYLGRLQQSLPHLQPEIKIDKPERLVNALMSYDIDFGLLYDHHLQGQDLRAVSMLEDTFGFVLHPSHPLASEASIYPLRLERERWIVREEGIPSRRVFDAWCGRHKLTVGHVSEFEATEAIKGAIKTGLGVSVLNYLSVFEEAESGQLLFIPMEEQLLPPRHLCFVYHPKLSAVPSLQQIVPLFSEWASGMPVRDRPEREFPA